VAAPGGTQSSCLGVCAVLLVFVSVNQVLVRLWARVPGTGSGARACVSMTRQSACSPRVMARCSMACLTGKCVPCGMAAPVIGGEGSEALCERLIGSGGSGAARAAAETPGSKQSCYVRESDTAGSSNRGANLV
jgi:hypothetical protein